MSGRLPEPVARLAAVLHAEAVEGRIEELATSTASAAEAAAAVGCAAAEIVKSLLFICDGRPVLVLVPGDRRADPAKVARTAGAADGRIARADELLRLTGFEPGGLAPFPLPTVEAVLLDQALLTRQAVWVGAGTPRHLAALAPADLARLAKARVSDLVEQAHFAPASDPREERDE